MNDQTVFTSPSINSAFDFLSELMPEKNITGEVRQSVGDKFFFCHTRSQKYKFKRTTFPSYGQRAASGPKAYTLERFMAVTRLYFTPLASRLRLSPKSWSLPSTITTTPQPFNRFRAIASSRRPSYQRQPLHHPAPD